MSYQYWFYGFWIIMKTKEIGEGKETPVDDDHMECVSRRKTMQIPWQAATSTSRARLGSGESRVKALSSVLQDDRVQSAEMDRCTIGMVLQAGTDNENKVRKWTSLRTLRCGR
jgi:hypothetical protein